MDYDPRITLLTPEGIELSQPLAGLGSRFAAQLVDLVVRMVILGVVVAVVLLAHLGLLGDVLIVITLFFLLAVYDIVFEVYAHGRTPGKRACGLRVLETDGTPVGWISSGIRNAIRLLEEPTLLPGVISIAVTARAQRLGDLAAGTIVVRERVAASPEFAPIALPARPLDDASDLTALSDDQIAMVADFLARRWQFTPAARSRLAASLANGLWPLVVTSLPSDADAEQFLEALVAHRRARR
ncbi:MAG: RDD family protein [Solirubrobacteraceae bacterium]